MTSRSDQVTAAIQELWRKLQIASAYSPTQPDRGRSSVRIALIGVLEFLSILFPDAPTLPVGLQDLLQGLVDLDRGGVIPLLEPADLHGRPPNSLGVELFRAIPAAAMTLLMEGRHGMSLEQAGREIASRLSKLGYRGGRISHQKIAKWREKMMTESVRENLAVQRYELALTWVKGLDAAAAVNFLLSCLPSLHPAEFPKNGMS